MFKKVAIGILLFLLISISGATLWVVFNGETIKRKAIESLNSQLDVPVKVGGKIDVTFISSFPKVSLVLHNVFIEDKIQPGDTLANLETIRVSFNFIDIVKKRYIINSISLESGVLKLFTDSSGQSNYDIIKKGDDDKPSSDLHLNYISLKNIELSYSNIKDDFHISNYLEQVSFAGSFFQKSFVIKTDLKTVVRNLKISGKHYFDDRRIEGSIELSYDGYEDCYIIRKNKIEVDGNFFEINGNYCNSTKIVDLKAKATGTDLRKALALLPSGMVNSEGFDGSGKYEINAVIIGKSDRPSIEVSFKLSDAVASLKTPQLKIEKFNVSGFYSSLNERLSIDKFSMKSGKSNLEGSAFMLNNNFTDFEILLSGNLDYITLNSLMGDAIKVESGKIDFASLKSRVKQNKSDSLWVVYQLNGDVKLNNFTLQHESLPDKLQTNASLSFNNQSLLVNDFKMNIGQNSLTFGGKLDNLLNYLQSDNVIPVNTLKLEGKFNSDYININDFLLGFGKDLSKAENKSEAKSQHLKWLNLSGKFDFVCAKLQYLDAEFTDLTMKVTPSNHSFEFSGINATGLGGKAEGKMMLNFAEKNGLELSLNSKLKNMDIHQIFLNFREFNQKSITSANLKGRVDADIVLFALWDKDFNFKDDALMMQANLDLRNGELIKLESLKALSGKLSEDQLEHIYFTDMTSSVNISNRVISIPKTRISSNLMQMDVSGKHSFDDVVDYSIVLNMKNLLAAKFRKNKTLEEDYVNDAQGGLNLYISMKGPLDNLKVSFDKESVRSKMKEDLKQEKTEFKSLFKKEEKTEKEVKSENSFYFDEKKPENRYIEWEED